MTQRAPFFTSVQGAEVLQLAEELEALGGGDVALAAASATALVPQSVAAGSSLVIEGESFQVDACHQAQPGGLTSKLSKALHGWVGQGLGATVVLLDVDTYISAASLIKPVAVAALSAGQAVGLSWQQSDGARVWSALGQAAQPAGVLTASRAGPLLAHGPSGGVVAAAGMEELDSLLRAAMQPHPGRPSSRPPSSSGAGAVGAGAQSTARPECRTWVVSLHLHHPAAGGGSLGALHVVLAPPEERGLLLKMLREVAGLHQHRRVGEHSVISSQLSLFNQVVAPHVAGAQRLSLLAGIDPAQPEAARQLAATMALVRHIQAVCTRCTGVRTADLRWVPCAQFTKHLQQAEEERQQAQAAAVAAAAASATRRQQALRRSLTSSLQRRRQAKEAAEQGQGQGQGQGEQAQRAEAGTEDAGGGSSAAPDDAKAEGGGTDVGEAAARAQQQHKQQGTTKPSAGAPPRQKEHYAEQADSERQAASSYAAQAKSRKAGRAATAKPAHSGSSAESSAGSGIPGATESVSLHPGQQRQGREQQQGLGQQGQPQEGEGGGVLDMLRQQFHELYGQTVGGAESPGGWAAASLQGSLPSPSISLGDGGLSPPSLDAFSHDAFSRGAFSRDVFSSASRDVFSSIGGGGGSLAWSPAPSLRVSRAGALGRASLQASLQASPLGPMRYASPAHPAQGQSLRGGELADLGESLSSLPSVAPRYGDSAGQGASLPSSRRGTPERPGGLVPDADLSAHMATARLQSALAAREAELREAARWEQLEASSAWAAGRVQQQDAGDSRHATRLRQEPSGEAAAQLAGEGSAGSPPEPSHGAGERHVAGQVGAGASGSRQGSQGGVEEAQRASTEVDLLYEHLLQQQQRYAAQDERRQQQEGMQELQQQLGGQDESQGRESIADDEATLAAQPRSYSRAGAATPWDAWDGNSWAQLDDVTRSLGAVTRPQSTWGGGFSLGGGLMSPGAATVTGPLEDTLERTPSGVVGPEAAGAADAASPSAAAGGVAAEGSGVWAAAAAGGGNAAGTLGSWLESTSALLGGWQRGGAGDGTLTARSSYQQAEDSSHGSAAEGSQMATRGLPQGASALAAMAPSGSANPTAPAAFASLPAAAAASLPPRSPRAPPAQQGWGLSGAPSAYRDPAHLAASRGGSEACPCPEEAGVPAGGEGSYAQLAAAQGKRQEPPTWQQQQQQQPAHKAGAEPAVYAQRWQQQQQQHGQQPRTPASVASSILEPAGGADPTDFNALLAALQRERQRSFNLQQELRVHQETSAEQVLALEVAVATAEHKLAAAQARCRAWEQGSPFSELFERYEAEVGRLEAEGQQLRSENATLARLLADAELAAALGASGGLSPDAAAVSRELHKRVQQGQASLKKVEVEREELRQQVQGMKRRDRLGELYRKQAEDCMRRCQELQRQLASKAQHLEAQCLAAARSGAQADVLEGRLKEAEQQAQQALAENADLKATVDALRQQVNLLRTTLGMSRVLQHLQPKVG